VVLIVYCNHQNGYYGWWHGSEGQLNIPTPLHLQRIPFPTIPFLCFFFASPSLFFLSIDISTTPRTNGSLYNSLEGRTQGNSPSHHLVHGLNMTDICLLHHCFFFFRSRSNGMSTLFTHCTIKEHYALTHFLWTQPQVLLAAATSSPFLQSIAHYTRLVIAWQILHIVTHSLIL
jgi:hypothetical protein